jgi:hypothetical protein
VSLHWGREHPGDTLPLEQDRCYQLVQLPDPLYLDTDRVRRLLAAKRRRGEDAAADSNIGTSVEAPAPTEDPALTEAFRSPG